MEESPEIFEDELAELAGLLLTQEGLDAMLTHVARIAVRAVPACDAAGMSLQEGERVYTAAVSEAYVEQIDQHQYDTDEGPCLDALRTGTLRRSPSLEADARW